MSQPFLFQVLLPIDSRDFPHRGSFSAPQIRDRLVGAFVATIKVPRRASLPVISQWIKLCRFDRKMP